MPAEVGAVYRPEVVIVPPVPDQLTAALLEPVTAATNCWLVPVWSVTLLGLRETPIVCACDCELPDLAPAMPAHPVFTTVRSTDNRSVTYR